MSARSVLAIAVAGLTVAACGTSPSDAVRAKVEQFAQTTRDRDYTTMCNQVLAAALVERLTATGLTCEQALQLGLGSVRDPALSIGKITVRATFASVLVLTTARGQAASLDDLQLTKTASGWRILSLGAPGATGAS